MIAFIVQIIATVFAVKGYLAHDLSLYPYIALAFFVCDLLGYINRDLKRFGLIESIACCAISCFMFKSINVYTISIGYVIKELIFVAGSIIMILFAGITSLFVRKDK